MDKWTKEKLKADLERYGSDPSAFSPMEAENVVAAILGPLMGGYGYVVRRLPVNAGGAFDLVADSPEPSQYQPHSVGIEIKHYTRPVGVDAIHRLLGAGILEGFNRVMLVSTSGYKASARAAASRELPLQIELLDIESLKTWLARIEVDSNIDRLEVNQILRVVSRRFAQLIAEDARNLDKLEWRNLEMLLAEVFEGLGFSVELTPGSKDQGKDIILECYISGNKHTYIVEVKHWRAGNRVGQSALKDFLNVIVREGRRGGLFLSTSGYCDNAFEMLTEIEREKLRVGGEEKVVSLCKTYVKADSGIWSPPELLTEVLFEGTQ